MHRIKFYCLFGLIYLISCSDRTDEDRITILDYLDTKNLVAKDTAGVYIVVKKIGESEKPTEISTVVFSYKGYYTDDVVFDRSPTGKDISLKLSNVVKGLEIGLTKFGKMSEGTILIPSDQGYGANPPFGIRKNAVLIYDVKVSDFY